MGVSWCFQKQGYPQIMNFNKGLHYKPFILAAQLYFFETPI